jgi:adenylate cyclase
VGADFRQQARRYIRSPGAHCREVVEALGLELFPAARAAAEDAGTTSASALDFYLRGKAFVRRELESERRNAAELFRQAIGADRGFGQAYAALADVLTRWCARRPPDWQAAEQEALDAATRAVQLTPGLPDAHLALGGILRFGHRQEAETAFRTAVSLGPHDPNVHYRFARFLVLEDRKREAIEQYEAAFRLAPDDYRFVVYTLQEYQALGDEAGERSALERSWPAIERHLAINPEDVRALGHGAGVLALLGRPDECEAFIQRALRIRPDDYGSLVTLACAAMLNRDPERALDLLDAAVATGRGDKEWMLNDNDLRPLHGDPRFEALVARMI